MYMYNKKDSQINDESCQLLAAAQWNLKKLYLINEDGSKTLNINAEGCSYLSQAGWRSSLETLGICNLNK